MKNFIKNHYKLLIAAFLYLAFIIWTILVLFVDVRAIGPNDSTIGLSSVNEYFKNLLPFNETLYKITDLMMVIPFLVMGVFAFVGVIELIKRKSLLKVDSELIALAIYYVVVVVFYFVFELFVVNYRPVLIEGQLEASYPSTHTLLFITILLSAKYLVDTKYFKDKKIIKYVLNVVVAFLLVFGILARFISGVHYFSDIIAGVLLGSSLYTAYIYIVSLINKKREQII